MAPIKVVRADSVLLWCGLIIFFVIFIFVSFIKVSADEEAQLTLRHDQGGVNVFNRNDILRVTTIAEYPYLTLKSNFASLTGNNRFEGYCKEVLDLVATELGFQYELHLVKDSQFGSMDEHGQWNGMIGELLRDEADMAVSSMILTRARAEVVDFSVSFADFRLAVVVNRTGELKTTRQRATMSVFSFLQPLKPSLWILILTVVISTVGYYYAIELAVSQPGRVIQALRAVLARIRRREVSGPSSDEEVSETPGESKAKSKAGLIIRVALIGFLLVIFCAYVARYSTLHYFNQSYHVSSTKSKAAESLEDLWHLKGVKIMVAHPGSTASYLQRSANPVHRGIHARMITQENYVRTTMQGVDMIRNGPEYAFTMEEIGAKYIAAQSCDLHVLPTVFGPKKSFAIAFPQNSVYRKAVNQAVLHLKETGIIQELESRNCAGDPPSSSRTKERSKRKRRPINLNMGNMAGIFSFLVVAYFASTILGVGEFFFKKWKFARKTQEAVTERRTGAGAPLAAIEEIESSL